MIKVMNEQYAPRLNTDELFELERGCYTVGGEYGRAVRFTEAHQSKNKILWKTFAEQYRLKTDAENGAWSGEFWGKMMRGAAWIYKCTSDAELYSVLEESVIDLLSAQEENGRFSTYRRELEFSYWDMWCRKYVLLGMQYFYDICESEELRRRIVSALCRHLDYIMDKVGEGDGKIDILDATTHNDWTWGALNSSSILEPVVRLYSLTKNERYLDFASYLVKRGGSKWGNIYELAKEGKKHPYEYPVKKAYEAMSYFEGVLEYYRVTGDEEARRAFLNFVNLAIESDLTVIGCSGTYHELFDHSSVMQTEYNDEVKQETCVTVTLMKACYQALCLTGDAKYADVIERAGYNAMLGSINFDKNTAVATDEAQRAEYKYDLAAPFVKLINGFTFDSYAPLYKDKRNRRVGGFQIMTGNTAYGCCACIGAAGVALMPISAVMESRSGIRINHLIEGRFETDELEISVQTHYPYGNDAKIKILRAPERDVEIGVRVPEFAGGKMKINGEVAGADNRGYSVMLKKWQAGEEISVFIPNEPRFTELNGKLSLSRGAVVYALDERNQDIDVRLDGRIESYEDIKAPFASRGAVEIVTGDGARVKFTDFASSGAEWDNKKNRMTVWIDKK